MVNEGDQIIQCFELQKGQINLGAGATVPKGTHIIHSVEDSEIKLIWTTGTDTVSTIKGSDYAVRGCAVEVVSGKVHVDTI
jgi:hypothetical protein